MWRDVFIHKHHTHGPFAPPLSVIAQVLSALTEGMGINAVTRLYGVSNNSLYRWHERLSGVKNAPLVRLDTSVSATAH